MKKAVLFVEGACLFALLFICGAARADALVSRPQFTAWLNAYARAPITLSSDELARAQQFQYVFIKGFLDEAIPGYFKDNADELVRAGVPTENILILSRSSDDTIEEGARALREDLESLAANADAKPLVLIAHSKGGAEALSFALQNAEFVEQHVRAIFIVQGSLKGSPIADYLSGQGVQPTTAIGWANYLTMLALIPIERLLAGILGQGVLTLTSDSSTENFQNLLNTYSSDVPRITDKVLYVTSHEGVPRMAPILQGTGAYMAFFYGPTDGLLLESSESLTGVGTPVASIEADHADLAVAKPISSKEPTVRSALTDAILKSVLRPVFDGF